MRLYHLRQRRQAVHVRHLDIQQHDVDLAAIQRLQGQRTVADGLDDFDLLVAFQHLRKQTADDGGIIDNHDFYRPGRFCHFGSPYVLLFVDREDTQIKPICVNLV